MRYFDFVVIGSGPAAQKGAIQVAKLGKKVAIVEKNPNIGGVSVHTGTIPSKTLREAALYLSGWDQRGLYGSSYRLKENPDIEDLIRRLEITQSQEVDVIRHQLARNGITIISGVASFVDAHHIRVHNNEGKNEDIYASVCLIATGSKPHHPDNIAFDNHSIFDSDGILGLKKLPRTLAVIGAGVIGVEYATIFSTLDVKVTLIDGRGQLLSFMDKELVEEFTHLIRDRGVMLRLNENCEKVEKIETNKVLISLQSGKKIKVDMVLVAAGRSGNITELNLENAGLEVNSRGLIEVNEFFQTTVAHIYAAGDVVGFPSLASTSMQQGRMAACHAFAADMCHPEQEMLFPFGIYSVPEMSMVGKTEQQLIAEEIPYEIGIARLRETGRGHIMGLQAGMLKMIFSLDDQRLLGVHILGKGATELIHIGQTALILGAKLEYFLHSVFNYPTLAEAYQIAALDIWNRIQ